MSKADLIKEQLQITRMVVNGTMADVSNEQAAAAPGGKAHPIGANLAHLIMSEDFIVERLIHSWPVAESTNTTL